jgi:hypothetical protein
LPALASGNPLPPVQAAAVSPAADQAATPEAYPPAAPGGEIGIGDAAARQPGLDARALIARLARPAPARIDFVEVRFSPMLREPLVVSGELGYLGPRNLERRVRSPYREQASIHGESVRVEREGAPPRSFALKRAPELRALLSGFAALLAGDPAALERDFEIELSGDEHAWTLALLPLERASRRQQITVNGSGDSPRCLWMLSVAPASRGTRDSGSAASAQGSTNIMLLGVAARIALPEAPTIDSLLQRCRTE